MANKSNNQSMKINSYTFNRRHRCRKLLQIRHDALPTRTRCTPNAPAARRCARTRALRRARPATIRPVSWRRTRRPAVRHSARATAAPTARPTAKLRRPARSRPSARQRALAPKTNAAPNATVKPRSVYIICLKKVLTFCITLSITPCTNKKYFGETRHTIQFARRPSERASHIIWLMITHTCPNEWKMGE